MAAKVNREICMHCGGCVSVCPSDALDLKESVLEVDPEKCINCKNCEHFCPVGAIEVEDG